MVDSGNPAAPTAHLVSEDVGNASSPEIVVQYVGADGTTETNPADGEEVFMRITLGDSTAF